MKNTKVPKKENSKKKFSLSSLCTLDVFKWIYIVWAVCFAVLIILDLTMQHTEYSKAVVGILVITMIELLLIIMSVSTILSKSKVKVKVLECIVFFGNALILMLRYLIGGRLTMFTAFVFDSFMGVYLLVYFIVNKTKHPTAKVLDKKVIYVFVVVMLFFMVNVFSHTYLSDVIYLYSLIPMGIITVSTVTLALTVFKKTVAIFCKTVWTKIATVIILLICSFAYGVTFIDTVNTSGFETPTTINCVIVDKVVTGTGARQITQCKLYVMIDGKKVGIDVSSSVYKSKDIGDKLIVNHYDGILNLPYYESGE